MIRLVLVLLVSYVNIHSLYTQDIELDRELNFFGDVMINASDGQNRLKASLNFVEYFEKYISDNKAIDQKKPWAKYISILSSDGPTIISWMVKIDESNYNYHGYIYNNNQYSKLQDITEIDKDFKYMTSTADNWYGCLYYKIMPHGKDYLLFGFDGGSEYNNVKIVDVLQFTKTGIDFGKDIFEDKDSPGTYANRLVINYSSDANVNLNYNEGFKMIVHDHLIYRMGQLPGQGPTFIPDGTYEGYEKKKDKWLYKEKLFDHIYNSAPRPNPVFIEEKN